ncbi:tRNA threonylcarbamoyladenosine dehydratase, partial [Clostridioides difficile]|nr:tRNA threonylcarbamoyladenosine dehydratase [Clostridioides difficile]
IELKKKVMNGRKVTPGSVSFVPSVGGLIIASVIVNELLGQ